MGTVPVDASARLDSDVPLLGRAVDVEGTMVRYEVSGNGRRDLLLAHGHGAHHRWWYRVAPLLEPTWRVTSFDFSGHGDSGRRQLYTGELWARELLAVIDASSATQPVVAAHSLGGRIALIAAHIAPEKIGGLILFDAGLWLPSFARAQTSNPPPDPHAPVRTPKVYPTYAEARRRFHLVPPQPEPSAEVLDPVARYSLRQVDGGWTWKQDSRPFPAVYDEQLDVAVADVTVPVTYVSGSQSLVVSEEDSERTASTIPGATIVRLPGMHHHFILDDPALCAGIINERYPG